MVVRFQEGIPNWKKDVQWYEFLSLDAPHPNGVLPAGNRLLLDNESTDAFSAANDLFLRQIRDETWLAILSFCDGVTLGNLVRACRFFYVAGHQPELWRDLLLRELHSSSTSATIKSMGDSWKDTFVMNHLRQNTLDCPSRPMKIPDIYSDDLYRLHSCRAFAIPPSWLEKEPLTSDLSDCSTGLIPRIPAEELTCEDFVEKFEKRNRPVVIQGAAKNWKAVQDWQDPAYLRRHTQGRTFRATSGAAPLPANFALEAFQQYCSNPVLEEAPLYLFDREALKPSTKLHGDVFPYIEETCPYFDPNRTIDNPTDEVGHDLFQVLGEGKRPDHTWMIIGSSHSGSVFHIDPNATHAWNAAIVGRKRWIFYPPGITPPGVHPSKDGDEVALPLSIGEWLLTFWREHQDRKETADPSLRPLECTAFSGDVVFVPHGYWHLVVNMDQVNVAVTHNFVSRSNLSNVMRFLKLKEDQISGCRDRAESIKPAQLHSSMVAALRDQFGKDTEWLVKALKQASDGWTCKAWKDDDGTMDGDEQPRKRSLENVKGVTGHSKDTKKHASSGSNVMVKAKASAAGSGGAPFSFSFL